MAGAHGIAIRSLSHFNRRASIKLTEDEVLERGRHGRRTARFRKEARETRSLQRGERVEINCAFKEGVGLNRSVWSRFWRVLPRWATAARNRLRINVRDRDNAADRRRRRNVVQRAARLRAAGPHPLEYLGSGYGAAVRELNQHENVTDSVRRQRVGCQRALPKLAVCGGDDEVLEKPEAHKRRAVVGVAVGAKCEDVVAARASEFGSIGIEEFVFVRYRAVFVLPRGKQL